MRLFSPLSPAQLTVMRIAAALHSAWVFLQLLPYAPSIFNPEYLGDAWPAWLTRLCPWAQSPSTSTALVTIGILCGGLLALKILPRTSAFIVFFVCTYIGSSNVVLARSPEYGFVGVLLAVLALVPHDQQWLEKNRTYLTHLSALCWIYGLVTYFNFGLQKALLEDNSWVTGGAVYDIFIQSYFRREWYGDFFSDAPQWVGALLTWSGLGIELLAPLTILSARARRAWNFSALAMHIGIAMFLSISSVSFGMLAFHLSLVEWELIKWRKNKARTT